jgi:hypothetical protein
MAWGVISFLPACLPVLHLLKTASEVSVRPGVQAFGIRARWVCMALVDGAVFVNKQTSKMNINK